MSLCLFFLIFFVIWLTLRVWIHFASVNTDIKRPDVSLFSVDVIPAEIVSSVLIGICLFFVDANSTFVSMGTVCNGAVS